MPIIEAMVRQWDRNLPLPIAIHRASLFFGLKDSARTQRASRGERRTLDQSAVEKLSASGLPMLPSSALPKILDFEEYKSLRGESRGG